jgi:hypothetical protein
VSAVNRVLASCEKGGYIGSMLSDRPKTKENRNEETKNKEVSE